jgi:hypothetical protein
VRFVVAAPEALQLLVNINPRAIMAQVKYFYGHYAWKRNSYLITMVVYRIAGRIPVRFVPVLLFRDICLNGSKQQCQSQRLTVHLKVNGKTSFPLSGSASVKESRPSTTLEVFPKEHDPVLVTLLWYSFRHNLKNVLHGVEQRPVTGERAPPPQHSSLDSSPRGFTISKTCSSKKPEPWAHCNKRKMSDDNKKQKAHLWLRLYYDIDESKGRNNESDILLFHLSSIK